MKKHALLFALFLPSFLLFTSGSDSETYKFAGDIHSQLETDTMPWRFQTGAVMYSFAGDYRNALSTWDVGMNRGNYTPTPADSLLLKQNTVADARQYILNRSKTEQLIIINEAHHNPKHRTFTQSLLEGLYKNGYRYLGLEAIFDTAINVRNFAIHQSGYYTVEPEFGNLIYEARKLGFTIFGYEATGGQSGKEREIEQARNIHNFMQKNTTGKYLIHCGYDHVYENEVRDWEKAMAGRLKEYAQIDPFTIDQVKFTEKSQMAYSHYFVYATRARKPFVLIGKNQKVFNGISDPKQTDISVIHPLTVYEHERPHWMAEGRVMYNVSQKKLTQYSYPLLIMAYRKGELEKGGIPADIIEQNAKESSKRLFLKKGQYSLVVKNTKYEIQDSFEIRVR
ncbi:MAG: hypothetical protein MUC87_18605 [Bacteroidia bacterium]|jgi:hypothetical protein|nr:hypothetical protein [Bacteroidia bacterium]